MAAADVRDMLDLPSDDKPRPAKKAKFTVKRPGKALRVSVYPKKIMLTTLQKARIENCLRC
jgi:hypothetical protein